MLERVQRSFAEENRSETLKRAAHIAAESLMLALLTVTVVFWGLVLTVAVEDLVAALDQYLSLKAQEEGSSWFAGVLYSGSGMGIFLTTLYLAGLCFRSAFRIARRKDEKPDQDASVED